MTDSVHNRPEKKSVFKRPVLIGCLGLTAIVILLIGGLLIWLFTSGKTLISEGFRQEIVSQVEASDLPESQKSELIMEIDRVTIGFQEGDVSLKEVTLILEQLAESPAMSVLKVLAAEGEPIANSSLSPSEKEDAETTISRFVYGVFEERIPEHAVNELIDPLLNQPSEAEEWQFRSDISDAELRDTLAKAKQYADDADIQYVNLQPDIAREVREVIDRVLSASRN